MGQIFGKNRYKQINVPDKKTFTNLLIFEARKVGDIQLPRSADEPHILDDSNQIKGNLGFIQHIYNNPIITATNCSYTVIFLI